LNIRCPQCHYEVHIPDNQIPPPHIPIECPYCRHTYYLPYRPQPLPIYTIPPKPFRKGWWIAGILGVLLLIAAIISAGAYFGIRLFNPLLKTIAAIQEEFPNAAPQVKINTHNGKTTLLIAYHSELDITPETLEGKLGEEMANIAAIAYDTYKQEKPGKQIDYITVCAGNASGDDSPMSAENCITFEGNKESSFPEEKAREPKAKPSPPPKKIPQENQTNI
jgi:hypothetical protein